MTFLRSWPSTIRAYRSRNVAVATTNMSIAAMSVRWLCRKLRQVGEGTLGRHGRYLPTVAWLTLMPSLSSSPWMRGAPQSRLAKLMSLPKTRFEHIDGVARQGSDVQQHGQ